MLPPYSVQWMGHYAVLRVHNQLQTLLLARNLLRSEGVIAMLSADGYLGHTSAPLLTLDLTENEVRCLGVGPCLGVQ